MMQHVQWIRSHPEFSAKLIALFSEPPQRSVETDPDLMIYSGFFNAADKQLMQQVRAAGPDELAESDYPFMDKRLSELFFRYKARNYPATLSDEEQDRWAQFCANKLFGKESAYLTFNAYFERIQELASRDDVSARDLNILEDLKYYAESIVPYN